jgi:hypothetical protein
LTKKITPHTKIGQKLPELGQNWTPSYKKCLKFDLPSPYKKCPKFDTPHKKMTKFDNPTYKENVTPHKTKWLF